LRKVVSITQVGDEYVVETTTSTLEEAFEELDVNFSKKLDNTDLNPYKAPQLKKGVYLKQPSSNGKFALTITEEFELFNEDGQRIAIEGSIEFDIDLYCGIEIKNCQLKKVICKSTLNEEVKIKAILERKKGISEEFPLGTFYFAPIVVGPVTFVPEVKIVLGLKCNLGMELTAEVSQTASITGGVEFEDDKWRPIGDFSCDFSVPLPELTVGGDVKAYLGPNLGLKIYGVVGPHIDINGYFRADAQFFPQQYFKIYGGIEGSAGIEFTVLSFFKVNYEVDIFQWERLIFDLNEQVKVGQPPVLSWVNEPGYENDGVEPGVGCSTDTFVFRVKYADPNNDEPGGRAPLLHIIKDDKEIPNSPFLMWKEYQNNYSYVDGVIFYYVTKLSSGTNYKYYFEATDTWMNKASGSPTKVSTGPLVLLSPNKAPFLDWTYEQNYDNTGVYPQSGKGSTFFVFRILYKDPDGDPPLGGCPYLNIFKSGKKILGVPFSMYKISGNNYSTGVIYSCKTTLQYAGTDYAYCFEARDIYEYPATGSPTKQKSGPNVGIEFNNAPTLSWTGETNYIDDGLNPESGRPSFTTFEFRVKYTDLDDDPPLAGYPKLHVLKGGVEITSSPFTMTNLTWATDYYNGVIYGYSLKLPAGENYSYYFEAKDIEGVYAAGDPTLTKDAPNVYNNTPTLSWTEETNYVDTGFYPATGRPDTDFVFRVKYTDKDNDPPMHGYPKLRIKKGGVEISTTGFTMSRIAAVNYSSGPIYTFTIKLSTGEYEYCFEAKEECGEVATGAPVY
ncbi:MAG: hypothetical protein N2Z73_00945, partial [Endomicrobia bacterium]|nr:hypothetical protein [Endomicrobiia bacterium]